MDLRFKFPSELLRRIHTDLARRHEFAAERVGFISCRVGALNGGIAIMAHDYHPVDDGHYVNDPHYGAKIGAEAIRLALEFAYNNKASMFHIHKHEHRGKPRFSGVDIREYPKFIPDFWKVQSHFPHGAIVLSEDRAVGLVWYPGIRHPLPIAEIWEVGVRTRRL